MEKKKRKIRVPAKCNKLNSVKPAIRKENKGNLKLEGFGVGLGWI